MKLQEDYLHLYVFYDLNKAYIMKKNIKKPNAILFVCNINSIRSPMAEAITKEWFDQKIFVDSCGIKFGKIDYLAVEVMAEKKLNLAGHKSKLFSELDNTFFD